MTKKEKKKNVSNVKVQCLLNGLRFATQVLRRKISQATAL